MNIIETLRQKGITCCTVISFYPLMLFPDPIPYVEFKLVEENELTDYYEIELRCETLE